MGAVLFLQLSGESMMKPQLRHTGETRRRYLKAAASAASAAALGSMPGARARAAGKEPETRSAKLGFAQREAIRGR